MDPFTVSTPSSIKLSKSGRLRLLEIFPLSVTQYSVIWHRRSCVVVPTKRPALCHRLLGVELGRRMMSFNILTGGRVNRYNICACGHWGLGWGMAFVVTDTPHVIIADSISYLTANFKQKQISRCSPSSWAVVISKVRCGLGQEDHRNAERLNNDCIRIAAMYSCWAQFLHWNVV